MNSSLFIFGGFSCSIFYGMRYVCYYHLLLCDFLFSMNCVLLKELLSIHCVCNTHTNITVGVKFSVPFLNVYSDQPYLRILRSIEMLQ